VAEASENGALLRVVTELYDQRNNPMFERLGRHFERVDTWREAVAEHRLVVGAIAAQDPTRARAAMREHLQRSHDRFGAAWAGGDPAIRPPPEREAA
jgi:DNA-binding GntR family transcriptional regulator